MSSLLQGLQSLSGAVGGRGMLDQGDEQLTFNDMSTLLSIMSALEDDTFDPQTLKPLLQRLQLPEEVLDVAHDILKESLLYGKEEAFRLSRPKNKRKLVSARNVGCCIEQSRLTLETQSCEAWPKPDYGVQQILDAAPGFLEWDNQLQQKFNGDGPSLYPYAQAPNGCSIPSQLREQGFQLDEIRALGRELKFVEACNCHDMCFYSTSKTMERCNDLLWRDLRILCDQQTSTSCSGNQCQHDPVAAGLCGVVSKLLHRSVEKGNDLYPWIYTNAKGRQEKYEAGLQTKFAAYVPNSNDEL